MLSNPALIFWRGDFLFNINLSKHIINKLIICLALFLIYNFNFVNAQDGKISIEDARVILNKIGYQIAENNSGMELENGINKFKRLHGIYSDNAYQYNDWDCVPYNRVGPIKSNMNIQDLNNLFGNDNLKKSQIYGAEGIGVYDVTIIYPDTDKELIIYWKDNKYGEKPESVTVKQKTVLGNLFMI